MSTDGTTQYPALDRADNATDWRTHRTADVYSRCTPHNATFLAAERDSESTALIAAKYTAVIATILSALKHTDDAADFAALDPSLDAAICEPLVVSFVAAINTTIHSAQCHAELVSVRDSYSRTTHFSDGATLVVADGSTHRSTFN